MEENYIEIPVIETPKIKVYAKIDSNKVVKEINSSIFIRNPTDFIEIDEGYGDKYSHAQSQYLGIGLIDSKGRYNYKWDNKLIELTEEEKNILFPPVEPQPSEVELLKTKLDFATKQLEQQEELIVELAMKVYQ